MIDLRIYGWNDALSRHKQVSAHNALPHGRIAVVHRTCYEVIAAEGTFVCELTGAMMFGRSDSELPCTGDWVVFQPLDDQKGIIVDRLPRARALYRRKIGSEADRQAIAVHVDKAFIVQSFDEDFSVRRVERFVVQLSEEDITPVLILNKADLDFDKQRMDDAIKHLARRMSIFFTSIHRAETISRLRDSIAAGETVVFVGSSGVGKSSLVNALSERSALLTSGISSSTGKGRHTSTRREMVLMDSLGVLIDTPGVREFGLTGADAGTLAEILDIADLAQSCRFPDCSHTREPGCAVVEAVGGGLLDPDVYKSYLKLKREAWHFTTSEHEKRKRDKSFSKLVDQVKKRKANP